MDKNYLIKGVNGQIILTKNRVKIARKGALGFLTSGLAGVKEIPIKNISSIQMKKATNVTNGYLQFSLPGGNESKKGIFDATHDENTVMFSKKHQEDFLTVKKYIDSIMDGEEINFDDLNLPLSEEDNKTSTTQQVSTNTKNEKTFSWKYLIPIYGFYLIFKNDNAKKTISYILNIIVTIIVIAILSGGDETNKSDYSIAITQDGGEKTEHHLAELTVTAKKAGTLKVSGREIPLEANKEIKHQIPLAYGQNKVAVVIKIGDKEEKKDYAFYRLSPAEIQAESDKKAAEECAQAPEKHLKVLQSNWQMDGFGAVAKHTVLVQNNCPIAVKDIEFCATYFAPSGSRIDSTTKTVYQRIPPKSALWMKFSGFVNSQASSSSVKVKDARVSP